MSRKLHSLIGRSYCASFWRKTLWMFTMDPLQNYAWLLLSPKLRVSVVLPILSIYVQKWPIQRCKCLCFLSCIHPCNGYWMPFTTYTINYYHIIIFRSAQRCYNTKRFFVLFFRISKLTFNPFVKIKINTEIDQQIHKRVTKQSNQNFYAPFKGVFRC